MKRDISTMLALAAVLIVCPAFAGMPATQPAARPSTEPPAAAQTLGNDDLLRKLAAQPPNEPAAAAPAPVSLYADARVVSFGDGYTVSIYQVRAKSDAPADSPAVSMIVRQDTHTGNSIILDQALPSSLMQADARSFVISCATTFDAGPRPLVITSGESTLTFSGIQAESIRNAIQQQRDDKYIASAADASNVFVLEQIQLPPTNNLASTSQLILSAVPVSGTGSPARYTLPATDSAQILSRSAKGTDPAGMTIKDGTITIGQDITLTFDGKTFKEIDLTVARAGPPAPVAQFPAAQANNASVSHTPAPTLPKAAGS